MDSLKEGEWPEVVSLIEGNGHVTEVASLVQGEWSCYRAGHFNGGRMVTLQKWSLQWRENGHVTEVVSLEIENGHIMLVVILMERE